MKGVSNCVEGRVDPVDKAWTPNPPDAPLPPYGCALRSARAAIVRIPQRGDEPTEPGSLRSARRAARSANLSASNNREPAPQGQISAVRPGTAPEGLCPYRLPSLSVPAPAQAQTHLAGRPASVLRGIAKAVGFPHPRWGSASGPTSLAGPRSSPAAAGSLGWRRLRNPRRSGLRLARPKTKFAFDGNTQHHAARRDGRAIDVCRDNFETLQLR
jgi:hypothetical protein